MAGGVTEAVVRQKYIQRMVNAFLFMPQFSPADIRDVAHQGSMSLLLGGVSECSAVELEDLPSVKSDPVFLVQDSNEGGRDCNVSPNNSASAECVSR